jgi:23S rRNA (uracil1939-C5)-methyltransferase
MNSWPETIELTLDGMAQGGEGVGRDEGRVVFARGGLLGEHVRVQITEQRDAYARGDVTEVLQESPDRVPPRLPGADHMPWQHIAYDAQLRFKRQILSDQLAKIGGLGDAHVEETVPAPREWGYRSGARLHVQNGVVGYYAAESHDLQPISHDPLLMPVLNDALADFQHVVRAEDEAQEVVMRASETHGYVVAALHGSHDMRLLAQSWRDVCPALAGVVLPQGVIGADHVIEEIEEISFRLQPNTFFQVNVAAARTLLRLIRERLGEQRAALLDLYCGAGVFTLPLAAHAEQITGIEEHRAAIADAEANAADNGISNARFIAGHVERALADMDESFDTAVLDPPRRGCHPKALEALVRLAPSRIVYVSCHPGTLARDLKQLVAGGYRVVSVQPVDLFPQTAHIESVTLLVRE